MTANEFRKKYSTNEFGTDIVMNEKDLNDAIKVSAPLYRGRLGDVIDDYIEQKYHLIPLSETVPNTKDTMEPRLVLNYLKKLLNSISTERGILHV